MLKPAIWAQVDPIGINSTRVGMHFRNGSSRPVAFRLEGVVPPVSVELEGNREYSCSMNLDPEASHVRITRGTHVETEAPIPKDISD